VQTVSVPQVELARIGTLTIVPICVYSSRQAEKLRSSLLFIFIYLAPCCQPTVTFPSTTSN